MKGVICSEKFMKLMCKWIVMLLFLFEMLVLFIYISDTNYNKKFIIISSHNSNKFDVENQEQQLIDFSINTNNSSNKRLSKHSNLGLAHC
jgi:hypothetical protein